MSPLTCHNGAIVVWDDNMAPVRNAALADVPNSVFFVGIGHDATPIPEEGSAT